MKRRTLLAGGTTGVLAACASGVRDAPPKPTLVLVHGAWHGAWCWERVTPLLAQAGYRCVAVTLPGMGERKSELSLAIDLDSHIDAVAIAARAGLGHNDTVVRLVGGADA